MGGGGINNKNAENYQFFLLNLALALVIIVLQGLDFTEACFGSVVVSG